MPAYNRRNKVKSSSKYDNVKGDEKIIKLHTRVQDVFAANLVHLVCDDEGKLILHFFNLSYQMLIYIFFIIFCYFFEAIGIKHQKFSDFV